MSTAVERATSFLSAGDAAGARKVLEEHLAAGAGDPGVLVLLARAVALEEGPEAALERLSAPGSPRGDRAVDVLRLELCMWAGRYDEAIARGSALLRECPDSEDVAAHLLDALELAGRTAEAMRLVEHLARRRATRALAESRRADLAAFAGEAAARTDDVDLDRLTLSAESSLPRQEADLQRMVALFGGNTRVHAHQVRFHSGHYGYAPVHALLTPQRLGAHVEGRATLGLYVLDESSRTRTLVLDLDVARPYLESFERSRAARQRLLGLMRARVERLLALASGVGLRLSVETSGFKGYHLWAFLESVPAGPVRRIGQRLLEILAADVPELSWEVFPKQDRLAAGGLGNLVKLPWGIHRRTGRRSLFVDPVALTPLPDQVGSLRACIPHTPAELEEVLGRLALASAGFAAEVPSGTLWDGPPTPVAGASARVFGRVRVPLPARFPPAVEAILEGCGVVRELVGRARLGRTLSVKERHVLVQVLAHVGEDGRLAVHQVLAQGESYDPDEVNGELRAVSPQAIGCSRIGQLLSGLAGAAGCCCPMDLPDDAYASPLVHAGVVPRSATLLPRLDRPSSEPGRGGRLWAVAPYIRAIRDTRQVAVLERLLAEQRVRLERELGPGVSAPPEGVNPAPQGRDSQAAEDTPRASSGPAGGSQAPGAGRLRVIRRVPPEVAGAAGSRLVSGAPDDAPTGGPRGTEGER